MTSWAGEKGIQMQLECFIGLELHLIVRHVKITTVKIKLQVYSYLKREKVILILRFLSSADSVFSLCYFVESFQCRFSVNVADIIRSQYTDQVSVTCLVVFQRLMCYNQI